MATEIKMNLREFEFLVPGKWILAGEHAVIRGSEALVFPLTTRFLRFNYAPHNDVNAFQIVITGTAQSDLEMIIWSVFERYLERLHVQRSSLRGMLTIHSEIVFGAGMGASATLAVGLSRFFAQLGLLEGDIFQLSKEIEDLFHGESSGVDVAVALHQKPLVFKKGAKIRVLDQYFLPHLFISHCDVRGATKDCVEKVKLLIQQDEKKYTAVDEKMRLAVSRLKDLTGTGGDDLAWAQSIELAQSCFIDWGLVPYQADEHIRQLKQHGALACKMTGSGGGGYILSLWPAQFRMFGLPGELQNKMIKVN